MDRTRAAKNSGRVAKFACPRVLDGQKMSEDNQKSRCGCPPDYQIFWGDINYLMIFISTISPQSLLFQYKYQFDK